jgi:hypothetical protein
MRRRGRSGVGRGGASSEAFKLCLLAGVPRRRKSDASGGCRARKPALIAQNSMAAAICPINQPYRTSKLARQHRRFQHGNANKTAAKKSARVKPQASF